MEMEQPRTLSPPHVFLFPLPLQGPVNCMLKLAELLCLADFHVTFLNTDHIQGRLLCHSDVKSRFARFQRFRFETLSDGLPSDHPRGGAGFVELVDAVEATKPRVKDMITSDCLERPLVTCVIADGIMGFVLDVAKEIGIPLIFIETISPCCLLVFLSIHKLIEAGEIPFKGKNLDALVGVSGAEGILRRRDLPGFCRNGIDNNLEMELALTEAKKIPQADGLILNSFDEIEGNTLTHLRSHCQNLYAIGPLHALLKNKLAAEEAAMPPASSNSMWEEDESCMMWLDKQPLDSVMFVSFGSQVVMTRHQLMEFWHGLVNSGKRFLWVIREKAVGGEDWDGQIPAELSKGTTERGYIVGWAPQEKVLAHPAIGGFLTHSGWNSTIESIHAGVPMICWPQFVDQQVISRFVEEVWKIGLDMKDTCERVIVEKMIRELMEVRKDELKKNVDHIANLSKRIVSEDGPSYCDLDRLIEDIRAMGL